MFVIKESCKWAASPYPKPSNGNFLEMVLPRLLAQYHKNQEFLNRHIFNTEYLYSMIKNLLGIYTMQFGHSQHTAKMCWQTGRELCQNYSGRFDARQYYPLVNLIPILTLTTSPVVIISLSYPITQSTLLLKIFLSLYFQKWNQKNFLIWWWTEKSSLQNIEATTLCILKMKKK